MPRNCLILFACFLAGTLVGAIGIQAATAQGNPRAAIVSDEQNGIVRIVIDGKDVAQFNPKGLTVEGQISASEGVIATPLDGEPLPAAVKDREP